MTQLSLPLLRGKPVFVLKRGHYPNKSEVQQLQAANPDAVLVVETLHQPFTTFVVTAVRKH